MAFNNLTDQDLIDRAKKLRDKGGCSGASLDFLDDLAWHGFSTREDGYNMEVGRLEQLLVLHGV